MDVSDASFYIFNEKERFLEFEFNPNYLESNFGKQIGVQLSECLNDSDELTRLKMR
jgi:hypothetical protein